MHSPEGENGEKRPVARALVIRKITTRIIYDLKEKSQNSAPDPHDNSFVIHLFHWFYHELSSIQTTDIGDSLLFHHGTPLSHTYNTMDTYFDHGNDIRERMEKENPLSEYSRITWSRPNIFKKPRRNELTSQGQIIHQVFLLNPQQTGMMAVTVQ